MFYFFSSDKEERKKAVQFTVTEDLMLLTEVVGQNPYTNGRQVWTNVAATVTAAIARGDFLIDARRARERTQLLVKHYKSNNRAQLKK